MLDMSAHYLGFTGRIPSSLSNVSLSSSSKSLAGRRDYPLLQWRQPEERSLLMEVIAWVFTDLVSRQQFLMVFFFFLVS